MKPAFTNRDYNLFMLYISKSKNYFEFGSGGSTYEAYNKNNIKKIYSVESSEIWIHKIINSLKNPDYQINKSTFGSNKLNFFSIDFNTKIGHLGLPLPSLNDNIDFLIGEKNKCINSINLNDDKLLNGKVIAIEKKSPFNCLIEINNDNKTKILVHPKNVRIKDKNLINNFSKYYNSIISLHKNYSPNLDLILIDGRFRVMCALKSYNLISKDCIILIDDFLNRDAYHILLDYYDIVKKGERMVALKKKENMNISDDLFEKYENDVR